MLDDIDLLVCGAGPVGCVIAERAASVLGWRVLLIDRRSHLAGNCYDTLHRSGVLVHQYGPHYFRTNNPRLLQYLSQFTDWIPACYEVKSLVRNELFPFPINLTTLEQFFGKKLNSVEAQALLNQLREPHPSPSNSEEYVLSRVGRELYHAFYRCYTEKQWGLSPRDLDPSVCGRIPVRLNRDIRYVDQRFQVMPRMGFTSLFNKMVSHPSIRLLLDCDFADVRYLIKPRHATVYTGPIDAYFNFQFGALPYRSLNFEFVEFSRPFVQPCVQINYPGSGPYTRSVEIKHVTRQHHPHSVLSFESSSSIGEPYYPIPASPNRELYELYRQVADRETVQNHVYFCGRLAQYRYFNTDEVIEEALKCFHQIQKRFAPQLAALSSSALQVA